MIQRMKILQEYGYTKIFYLWLSLGFGFALLYYIIHALAPQHGLLYLHQPLNTRLPDFINILYFSFITLTTTGYGDIVPLGASKILSILEIVFGLIVFAFLISKLLSSRQQKIIEELYNISFEDRINKLRSGLYVYRANLSRTIDKIKSERRIRHYDLTDIESNLEGLKISINRVSNFLIYEEKKPITKLNDLSINLLFNSISLSTSRIIEVLNLLKAKKCLGEQKMIQLYISDSVDSIKKLQKVYKERILKEEVKSTLDTIDNSLKQIDKLLD